MHLSSHYFGQRINVGDVSCPKVFACFAELMLRFPSLPPESQTVEGRRMPEAMQALEDIQEGAAELMGSLETFAPAKWEKEAVVAASTTMRELCAKCMHNSQQLHDFWRSIVSGRQAWLQLHVDGTGVVWQSLCTTLLSRTVRTEEDIDTGEFTKVRLGALKNVWKRTDVNSAEDQKQQVEEMRLVFRKRIRDMKRIYKYYASLSEEGSVNELDHSEFWRFVKECKLGQYRKELPSFRLELIFQEAQGYERRLAAAWRAEHPDAAAPQERDGPDANYELSSNQFIEILVKLGCRLFPKGTPSERLEQFLHEIVLPNAASVNVDVFRERLANDQMQDLYRRHKRNLKRIFDEYASPPRRPTLPPPLPSPSVPVGTAWIEESTLLGPLGRGAVAGTLRTTIPTRG